MLSAEATTIELQLNEWLRFDWPGQYRVQVVSHRVANVRESSPALRSPTEVISNELEITIAAPPPEWQNDTLRQALEILDQQKLIQEKQTHQAGTAPARSPGD